MLVILYMILMTEIGKDDCLMDSLYFSSLADSLFGTHHMDQLGLIVKLKL
jgi:hypothetical protein